LKSFESINTKQPFFFGGITKQPIVFDICIIFYWIWTKSM